MHKTNKLIFYAFFFRLISVFLNKIVFLKNLVSIFGFFLTRKYEYCRYNCSYVACYRCKNNLIQYTKNLQVYLPKNFFWLKQCKNVNISENFRHLQLKKVITKVRIGSMLPDKD